MYVQRLHDLWYHNRLNEEADMRIPAVFYSLPDIKEIFQDLFAH